jgi:hypothetical protein
LTTFYSGVFKWSVSHRRDNRPVLKSPFYTPLLYKSRFLPSSNKKISSKRFMNKTTKATHIELQVCPFNPSTH